MGVWPVFIDAALAAMLLLTGQLLRSKITLLQKLSLPSAIIGGFIGLSLGPNGADLLPFSPDYAKYPGILIGLIFASLPFASTEGKTNGKQVYEMFSYSSAILFLQWAGGLLLTILVLQQIWPNLHTGFGSLIAVGFVGGHGTAAAIGNVFADFGWDDATSLAMTSATIGILSAITGGILWIKWAVKTGHASYVQSFDNLSIQAKTGLIGKAQQKASVTETTISSVIDSFTFHLAIILVILGLGYGVYTINKLYLPSLVVPLFCNCFILAYLAKHFFAKLNITQYIDKPTMAKFGGSLTDFLIIFGISSIKITLIIQYAIPLLILFVTGIIICVTCFYFFGPRSFDKYWFEKSLFTWGWVTGVSAMAIALYRIIDSKNNSGVLGQFAIAYLFILFFELALVAFAPTIITAGYGLYLGLATLAAAILLLTLKQGKK